MDPVAAEHDMIRAFQAGDTDVFKTLFGRHVPALRAFIGRRVPARVLRRVSIADVLQDVSIVAHEKLGSFRPHAPGSLRAWLLDITRKKVHETLRRHHAARRNAAREVTRGPEGHTVLPCAPQASASQVAIARETAEQARLALESLPPDHQWVLRLAREQGLPLREVAERMGRTREAVKKLYGRAICGFKAAFERVSGGA